MFSPLHGSQLLMIHRDECKRQVHQFPNAVYKSFPNRLEADLYLSSCNSSSKKRKIEESDVQQEKSTKKLKMDLTPVTTVFTDGCCRGNGQHSAKAGCGVYFGEGDPRNLAIPLPQFQNKKPTNQRAELYVNYSVTSVISILIELQAAIKAIQTHGYETPLEIATDSQYVLKCRLLLV